MHPILPSPSYPPHPSHPIHPVKKIPLRASVSPWCIFLFALIVPVLLPGCSSIYYNTMEKFGYEKRDIMVSRVEKARDSQNEAKEQFQTALERFHAVIGAKDTPLSKKYDELNAELARSEARADAVHKRVDDVESVSEALFDEWESELKNYHDATLRADSEKKLKQTRMKYDQLIAAMRKAESKLEPVLDPLRDQVLYLKHHLNAQAIDSLQDQLGGMETDVAALIKDLEASIKEADGFIQTMKTE